MKQKKFDYEPIAMTIGMSVVSVLLDQLVYNKDSQQYTYNLLFLYGLMAVVAGVYMYARGKEKDIDLQIWIIVAVLIPISIFTLSWADQKEKTIPPADKDDEELLKLIDKLTRKQENDENSGLNEM